MSVRNRRRYVRSHRRRAKKALRGAGVGYRQHKKIGGRTGSILTKRTKEKSKR